MSDERQCYGRTLRKTPESVMDAFTFTYEEMCEQRYGGNNCRISAGLLYNNRKHPEDTVYFCLERDDDDELFVAMRPDELQALVWVCSGALWSERMALDETLKDKPAPSTEKSTEPAAPRQHKPLTAPEHLYTLATSLVGTCFECSDQVVPGQWYIVVGVGGRVHRGCFPVWAARKSTAESEV